MKIEKNWINDVYTSLTDTLANDQHKITSGITKKTFNSGSKATAAGINTLINEIKGLRSNEFLGRYADCFTGNETLNTTTSGAKILDNTKEQIDNYVTKILQICGNKATSQVVFESGCTDKGDNFERHFATGDTNKGDNFERHPATGCNHNGNDFERHPATGCTNKGNDSEYHPFSTYSGNTNKGNNFEPATCGRNFGGCINNSQSRCTKNVVFSGNSATGNTNKGNNFKPSFNADRNFTGNVNQGNDFQAAFGSGDTNKGNDFQAAFNSGDINKGNNFQPAFNSGDTNKGNTFSEDVRTRTDFNVKINGTPVANSNFI